MILIFLSLLLVCFALSVLSLCLVLEFLFGNCPTQPPSKYNGAPLSRAQRTCVTIKSNAAFYGELQNLFQCYKANQHLLLYIRLTLKNLIGREHSINWHDKCNIRCRYCIYHVKFNVCLVTKPLGVCYLCYNTDLGFDNSWYHAQPHPTIVYYTAFTLTPRLNMKAVFWLPIMGLTQISRSRFK